jgi:hypothetical protein
MLHEFLDSNRATLIERCLGKLAQRPSTRATGAQLEFGVPVFLDEVIRTLQMEQGSSPMQSRRVSARSVRRHSARIANNHNPTPSC